MLDQLAVPPPDISTICLLETLKTNYDLGGTLEPLGGERDINFLLQSDASPPSKWLVKISNPGEESTAIAFQSAALDHLSRYAPRLPIQRQLRTVNDSAWTTVGLNDNRSALVRVFGYLEGTIANPDMLDEGALREIGRQVAQLDLGLRGFVHAGALQPTAWDIQRFDQFAPFLELVENPDERTLIARTLNRFVTKVKPVLPTCRSQVIHNDISFHNIVLNPDQPGRLSGIFDFGDMTFAPLVQELAVSAAEFSAGTTDPFSRCAALVAGYHQCCPLEDLEIELLPDLISARLAMSCVIEAWTDRQNSWSDERAHLQDWRPRAIQLLRRLDREGASSLSSRLRSACGITPESVSLSAPGASDEDWNRRIQVLGNAGFYSYQQPLNVVRGEGVWLEDKAGKRYLDAFNNVPHVGHCHPRVVDAIVKQTSRLNTNTRYLYDQLPDYAEQLLDTLPGELDTCYFVSSGSEANDLAWRMAKTWTGHSGGLVLQFAYHGVTDAVFDLSPAEKVGRENTCTHVVEMRAPDDLRGEWKRNIPDRGTLFADYCDEAINRLAENGHRPAAFFMDMIMSTNGIMVSPPGYLPAVYEKVRAAGGLCVADEVQSGFGRLGKSMWGFEAAGGIPDFVTLGKPIAGGYPMGMVVTRREIAERFESSCQFFSTTGGNPVACAAASAVLSVVQDERLMENAERIGNRIFQGLQALATRHLCIGDVRGSGLFIGVDLVSDSNALTPDPVLAKSVANRLKEQGVLVGVDGLGANVLKIRPPMVFNEEHCQQLLETLDRVLGSATASD